MQKKMNQRKRKRKRKRSSPKDRAARTFVAELPVHSLSNVSTQGASLMSVAKLSLSDTIVA